MGVGEDLRRSDAAGELLDIDVTEQWMKRRRQVLEPDDGIDTSHFAYPAYGLFHDWIFVTPLDILEHADELFRRGLAGP